jgi:ABC-type glutathione transport system ATPase component
VEPEAGSVTFDGENVLTLRGRGLRQFRERAQIVFQDPQGSLNPRLTAGEAVSEVLSLRGMSRERHRQRLRELFDRVGLPEDVLLALPHELSGGQQQRVGIARALATEPDFLVLDEPVSALDVSVQARIVNLLLDLQEELDLTYLFISHDLALVGRVSDRIVVMKDGGIVDEGAGMEQLRQSNHPYTRTLITAALQGPSGGAAEGR